MVIFSSNGAFIFLGERERERRSLEASCCFFLAAPRSTLSSFWMSDYPYGIVASFPLLLLHSSSFRHLHLGFLSGLRRGHLPVAGQGRGCLEVGYEQQVRSVVRNTMAQNGFSSTLLLCTSLVHMKLRLFVFREWVAAISLSFLARPWARLVG